MEYVTDNLEEEAVSPGFVAARRRRNIATPLVLAFFLVLYGVMFYQARGWNMSLKNLALVPFRPELLSRFGALTGATLSGGGEFWRLVTGAFVHLNLIHLAINCYCVFSLGRAVESYYGARRMFVLFVACSVVANVFTVSASPAQPFYVGTLGGLFGLDGVMLGFALRNRAVLEPRAFRRMVTGTMFWPVLWIVLSFTVPAFRGGVWGLVAGFGAGAVLGFTFEAAVFAAGVRRLKLSGAVNFLFAAALIVCALSWVKAISAAGPSGAQDSTSQSRRVLQLGTHVSREGGFEVPVPRDMTVTRADERVDIGRRGWVFYRISWRDAGPYDEPESLARSAISDRTLESAGDAEIREVHLRERERVRVGGEDAAFFVLSMLVRGDEFFYAQAILIHEGKVYTITFYLPASDELRREQVDAIIDGFKFTD